MYVFSDEVEYILELKERKNILKYRIIGYGNIKHIHMKCFPNAEYQT